jgi:GH25 family lysozyme M1 (1,4-beta-N-acetylmuramidase)
MTVLGLDVYSGNHFHAWTKARDENNVRFVIRKATQGIGYDDPLFTQDFDEIKAAGLLPGAYHFAVNKNNTAAAEAAHFLRILGPRRGCLLALDLEDTHDGQTMQQRAVWAAAWCDQVTKATGIRPLLYTYHRWAYSPEFTAMRKTYPLWIPLDPVGSAPVTQWTHVLGTLGNLDVDTFAGSINELRALAGIGPVATGPVSTPASPPPLPKPTLGDPTMSPIFLVTDGPQKGEQIFDYGFGPVHINGQESGELQAAKTPIVPISGATYDARFQGV